MWWMMWACTQAPPQFPDPNADLLLRLDQDGSQSLSAQELRGHQAIRVMAFVDRDRDGAVSLEELRTTMARVGDLPFKGGKAKAKFPPPPPLQPGQAPPPPPPPPEP